MDFWPVLCRWDCVVCVLTFFFFFFFFFESYTTPRMEHSAHVATRHPSGTRVHVGITGPYSSRYMYS